MTFTNIFACSCGHSVGVHHDTEGCQADRCYCARPKFALIDEEFEHLRLEMRRMYSPAAFD